MSKTNLNKSSPQNFELIFPVIPTIGNIKESNELTLNIYQSVIPSLTLSDMEVNWQGGAAHYDSGGVTFEPWFTNFVVDSDFSNWKALYKWIIYINNNKDRYGRARGEFTVDATFNITNNNNDLVLSIDFINVWPNMLGEISMSYREGEQYLTSNVNFMYDRYEVKNI